MPQLVPWTIALAALAAAAGVLAWWWTHGRARRDVPLPTEWSLTARPVFSTDERRVYRQLREALPLHIVLAKLPLVRFSHPIDQQQVHYWYELLGTIHVSFAVCSANGRVLAAIDLDQERAGSQRVQQIKLSVLKACRVHYLRCPMDQLPSIADLQRLVPQPAAAARAPQSSSASDTWAGAPASQTTSQATNRPALWQDSGFFQDSLFGPDLRGDSAPASELGSIGSILRGGAAPRDVPTPPSGDDKPAAGEGGNAPPHTPRTPR